MAMEIKVASFRRQVVIAIIIFAICALSIITVRLLKRNAAKQDRDQKLSEPELSEGADVPKPIAERGNRNAADR